MDSYNNLITGYRNKIDERLENYLKAQTLRSIYLAEKYPDSLFIPLNYIMSGGGKRIRPLIMLLTCNALGGDVNSALDAAIAVEILHNFTLVHDDIMDNANTRRGKETIHKKWSVNIAILVGDELIGLSYRSLLNLKTNRIEEVFKEFTNGVIEVCEGQALDNQFEFSDSTTLDDYRIMILKKTAKLIKISATIGAIIADANKEEVEAIAAYAKNLGLAFQIQDDMLDVFADEKEFGKKIGGDIIEKKKTFLYLKSLELCNEPMRSKLKKLYLTNSGSDSVSEIIKIYKQVRVQDYAKEEIKNYIEKANTSLFTLLNKNMIELLNNFSNMLLEREY